MNILVTGGMGFIGHNVVQMYEKLGHHVTIIDNCNTYNIHNRKEIDYLLNQRQKKFSDKIEYYNRNITDHKMLDWIFLTHKFDMVVHLASFPNQKSVEHNINDVSDIMTTALISLCELSKKYKVKRFVYISSSMVYGNFEDNINENAACNPIGLYGILKYTGEMIVKSYSDCFEHVIIRPTAVYGELDVSSRVIGKFFTVAMKNETLIVNRIDEKLDFTHVYDTSNGIVQASVQSNKIYNISYSESHKLVDIAEKIIEIVGYGKIDVQKKSNNFPSRGKLCIDTAKNDFTFEPTIDIDTGLHLYYNYLMNSPTF
jgi:nucleoside-diphosphate-sugar epimerase